LLQNNLVEAVILDYHMPEMDGLEVARAVRQIRPQLPIILLSGYPSKLPRELVDLIDGFVAKGAAPNLLREMLEEILGSRSVMRHPVSSEVLKESAVHSKRVVSDNVGRQKRRRLKGGR
jgi:CheY-like chemotaxis protein